MVQCGEKLYFHSFLMVTYEVSCCFIFYIRKQMSSLGLERISCVVRDYREGFRRAFIIFAWDDFSVFPGFSQALDGRRLHKHHIWLKLSCAKMPQRLWRRECEKEGKIREELLEPHSLKRHHSCHRDLLWHWYFWTLLPLVTGTFWQKTTRLIHTELHWFDFASENKALRLDTLHFR